MKKDTKTQRWTSGKGSGLEVYLIMKYEIEIMIATITEENMEDLKEILFGEP